MRKNIYSFIKAVGVIFSATLCVLCEVPLCSLSSWKHSYTAVLESPFLDEILLLNRYSCQCFLSPVIWLPTSCSGTLSHHLSNKILPFHSGKKNIIKKTRRVPVTAQWKQIWLVSMRMQVWYLALFSGLRIRHCRELWCRLQTSLGSHRCCGSGVGRQLQLQFSP